jgi:hypothetical protein
MKPMPLAVPCRFGASSSSFPGPSMSVSVGTADRSPVAPGMAAKASREERTRVGFRREFLGRFVAQVGRSDRGTGSVQGGNGIHEACGGRSACRNPVRVEPMVRPAGFRVNLSYSAMFYLQQIE